MAKRRTPEIVEMFCDICKKKIKDGDRLLGGGITIDRCAIDWQNRPVADATLYFDEMCDSCLKIISAQINETSKDQQRKLFPHQGDPCVYCNVPHDDVPVGPCRARIEAQ